MTDEAAKTKATPSAVPSLPERVRAWFDQQARLKVTVGPSPASTPPTTFSYMSGQRRVVVGVVISLAAVAAVFALAIAWPIIILPLMLLFAQVIRLLPVGGTWTDGCVASAVARAAEDLGTQTGKYERRIVGAPAAALGAELIRLQRLPSATRRDGARPTADDERLHIAAAGPVLRRYLRPVLTAGEHGNEPLGMVDVAAPLAPGAPWPVLESGNPTWDQPRRRPNRT
ncbi:MAG: hypothetical protein CVT62_08730 [Actinobacteria bacterium HGW-Actinobacteria-2]|nr:MAG: hypothetical protein CVT62_08730 [Actinobacteria bacterium HGW-Actinobacteria-2]